MKLLSKAINGTNDYQDVLKHYGIIAFQELAGFIPKNCNQALPIPLDVLSRYHYSQSNHPYLHYQYVIRLWLSQYGEYPESLTSVNTKWYDLVKDMAHAGFE